MKGITPVNQDQHHPPASLVAPFASSRFTRRHALQTAGFAALAAGLAPTVASAQVHDHEAAQDQASPVPGPREDGTNLWKVSVGGMDMEAGIDTHAFFPGEITINAGDAIHFAFSPFGMPGFHTVTFTSGEPLPELQIPQIVDGAPVLDDSGRPRIIFNPDVVWPEGRTEYDGTGYINSGLDTFRTSDLGPYVLTFTAPGVYEYVCLVHFVVMMGTVIVQEAGSDLPYDQADYDQMAREQFATLIDEGIAANTDAAARAGSTVNADGSTTWDVIMGPGGLNQGRSMLFVPREITINVGDTVRWTSESPGEPHTVTLLGEAEQPEDLIIEPQDSGQPLLVQNMDTLLPSAESPATFDGVMYLNSGFTGLPPEVNELLGLVGDTWEVTFTAPGDFPYYCVLHAGGPDDVERMTGVVTVEE